MSDNPKVLVLKRDDGAAAIFTDEPVQCGCGRMVAIMVNRDGTTRCIECDEKYVQEHPDRAVRK